MINFPKDITCNGKAISKQIVKVCVEQYYRTVSDVRYVCVSGFSILDCPISFIQDKFEETKAVIRIRKSKKDKQHNGQKKNDKKINNYLQNIHIKLKIE